MRTSDRTVGSLVPPVFDAHARILHPAVRRHGAAGGEVQDVAWAQVAAANGRQAHAGTERVAITGSWKYHHGSTQPGVWDDEPAEGSLPAAQAEVLGAVLARFTATAGECFSAVREGYGASALAPVATDGDLMSTCAGGSRACTDAVLTAAGIEVWRCWTVRG